MSLAGSQLTFSVSTGPLFEFRSPSDFSILLRSVIGDISFPFDTHFYGGMSGCSPIYGSERAISYYVPTTYVPSPIDFIPPTICDAYWQTSELSGIVNLTPSQLALFSTPFFSVSVPGTGLIIGHTSLEVVTLVPEPTVGMLVGIFLTTLATRRHRNQGRTRALLATDGASEFSLLREHCDRPICARV